LCIETQLQLTVNNLDRALEGVDRWVKSQMDTHVLHY